MGVPIRHVAAVTMVAVLTLGACSDDGNGTSSKNVDDLAKSGPGTCLLVGKEIDAEVSSLPTIDCKKSHTHEVYAVVTAGKKDDVYPGNEALEAVAQRECTAEFKPYVGSGPFDTKLFFSWLLPTLGSWNDHGDRTIICVASRFDNSPLVGSIKGSNL